jgi:anti-sigma factor ChrR (cupin superfamily)
MNNIFLCALAGELTPHTPSENLRARVLAGISQRPTRLLQAEEGEFLPVLKGVAVKRLRADDDTETAIWRMDAGTTIPAHGHAHEEECLVLGGSIVYAGRTLATGDYLGAAAGEHQSEIFSATGALLLIRGELRQ